MSCCSSCASDHPHDQDSVSKSFDTSLLPPSSAFFVDRASKPQMRSVAEHLPKLLNLFGIEEDHPICDGSLSQLKQYLRPAKIDIDSGSFDFETLRDHILLKYVQSQLKHGQI